MDVDLHYYSVGYSAENDPYCQPNGVLTNLLGLTSTKELNEFEAIYSALALQQLATQGTPSIFSVSSLTAIHHFIFRDVYPWAGEFRKVDIFKGHSQFETHQNIKPMLLQLFDDCTRKRYFKGLSINDFAEQAGQFLIELNRIHPFREGNGRTQRMLLSQMANNAGLLIQWEGVSDSAMNNACIEGLNGNQRPMIRLMKVYLYPLSSPSL